MKYLVLLAILILPLNLPAGEDHSHGPSYGQIEVPSTLPEVRAMIASKQSELTALLAAGDARGGACGDRVVGGLRPSHSRFAHRCGWHGA